MSYLPLFIDFAGKHCLFVGWDSANLPIAQKLLAAGAYLSCWGSEPDKAYSALLKQYPERLALIRGELSLELAEQLCSKQTPPFLLIAATPAADYNQALAALAQRCGVLSYCPLAVQSESQLGAIVERGELALAVKVDRCPELVEVLAENLAKQLAPNWVKGVAAYANLRNSEHVRGLDEDLRRSKMRELAAEMCANEGRYEAAVLSLDRKAERAHREQW